MMFSQFKLVVLLFVCATAVAAWFTTSSLAQTPPPATKTDAEVTGSADWRDYLSGKKRLRVALNTANSNTARIEITCDSSFRISQGNYTSRQAQPGEVITFNEVTKDPVRLVPEAGGIWTIKLDGTLLVGRYNGNLEVFSALTASTSDAKPHLVLINEPPFEDYVAGVLQKEIGTGFHIEAFRAQAIAARSYALSYLGRHEAENCDLCDANHCQLYSGLADPYGHAVAATRATRGQVLLYNGAPIKAVYSSTCGGETSDASALGMDPAEVPYLKEISDEPKPQARPKNEKEIAARLAEHSSSYCKSSRYYRWNLTLSADEMDTIVSKYLPTLPKQPKGPTGRVLDMRILNRVGAHVSALEIVCECGTWQVTGNDIRWLFGRKPERVRSTFFTLKVTKDRDGKPKQYDFIGGGWGHGLGMCQIGANGRANAGQTAEEILKAYYPGTELWSADIEQDTN
jgi:SpoIID/LytB domain protein